MFKNYLKIAWRSLIANRLFSILNITGLAVGISATLMILLWIENEYAYNKALSPQTDVFLVENNHSYNGKITTYSTTSPLLAPAIKQEIPQIKFAARTAFYPNTLLSFNDKKIYKDGAYADAEIFKIFNFSFIRGNAYSALKNVNDIAITQSTAIAFFGNDNIIGKTLKFSNGAVFNVSAVIKDFHTASTIKYDWIANFKIIDNNLSGSTWTDNAFETFVKTHTDSDEAEINNKLKNFIVSKDKDANAYPFLFPVRKLHLYNSFQNGSVTNDGNIKYVRMFTIIAFIILIIACINFMNLSTARSLKRAKEISVRKVLGANRYNLIKQFFGEAFLCILFAIALACVLIISLFPLFKRLMNLPVELHYFTPAHIIALTSILLLCALFAGAYPAFYLSAFNPVRTLQQQARSGLGVLFIRKGLVIFQFSACIVLMIAAIIIYQQIQFTKNRDLGFNKNNIIYTSNSDYLDNIDFLRDKLMASGVVKNISLGYGSPIGLYSSGSRFYWSGKDLSKNINISNTAVSPDYFSTFDIKMLEGRDFRNNLSDSNNVIINQSLASVMGSEGKVGGRFMSKDGQSASTIIGIVKDFVFDDFNAVKSKPLLYTLNKDNYGQIFIAIQPSKDLNSSIAAIKKIYEEIYPESLFQYKFLDETFNTSFQQETLINRLSALFGMLAVFISCLGLFGLSSFMAEQRKKEISVRKVLGASAFTITIKFSGAYLKLVLFAALIGAPSAWLLMQRWLNGYAYRIHIEVWVFLAVIILSMALAFTTVVFQSIKAATANPVKSLRTE